MHFAVLYATALGQSNLKAGKNIVVSTEPSITFFITSTKSIQYGKQCFNTTNYVKFM